MQDENESAECDEKLTNAQKHKSFPFSLRFLLFQSLWHDFFSHIHSIRIVMILCVIVQLISICFFPKKFFETFDKYFLQFFFS